jgi:hypothetical protein
MWLTITPIIQAAGGSETRQDVHQDLGLSSHEKSCYCTSGVDKLKDRSLLAGGIVSSPSLATVKVLRIYALSLI